jgi:type II secretory ATPase GspE/PulE/Tfp pilus assembly ATPase PilB-like protein
MTADEKNFGCLGTVFKIFLAVRIRLSTLKPKGDYKMRITYSFPADVDSALSHYKKSLETRFAKILEKEEKVAPEVIEEIVRDALEFRASDIHFEPQKEDVIIRFRVDGVLSEAGHFKKEYYENIINRIKVMSQLRTDEHFATQDGAIRFELDGKEVDMRISIAPTLDGEKITIRLLAQYVKNLALTELGLREADHKKILSAAKKPFGMILTVGPTGSGKTTTLYALLKEINEPGINVTTIEDPVEYKIIGTNQIQVNEEKNITFAKGLKSIMRQDPDIILVGEIRDHDTAEIAVNAAPTGHLLFSTFHANDAATAIPRLLEMEVEPFLLASTLEVIIAQRLARKICKNCRAGQDMTGVEIEKAYPGLGAHFSKGKNTVYESKGCSACNNTGYVGRVALFEFIEVTKEMQDLVLKNPSTNEIWELAKKQGAHTLLEDGVEKVKEGITTLSEVKRVVATD